MRSSSVSKACGIAASVVFVAAAVLQVVRTLTSPPAGLTPAHSHIATIVLAALWLGSAVATFTRKRSLVLVAIAGTFAFLPHFVISRAARGFVEIAYLIVFPFMVTLVWSAFKQPPHVGTIPPTPSRTSGGRMSV